MSQYKKYQGTKYVKVNRSYAGGIWRVTKESAMSYELVNIKSGLVSTYWKSLCYEDHETRSMARDAAQQIGKRKH